MNEFIKCIPSDDEVYSTPAIPLTAPARALRTHGTRMIPPRVKPLLMTVCRVCLVHHISSYSPELTDSGPVSAALKLGMAIHS